jgi:hypothetical protein
MKVYLLVWSHKHGQDYNCFSSEKLAYEHGIEIEMPLSIGSGI